MLHKVNVGKKTRMSFSRINEILDMPDLIEVQKDSYRQFIEKGLGEVLDDISPIKDFSERLVLEFVGYKIDESKPKRSVAECYRAAYQYRNRFREAAGSFHGRFPAHDGTGHVRHQRSGTRHCQPARSLARRILYRNR